MCSSPVSGTVFGAHARTFLRETAPSLQWVGAAPAEGTPPRSVCKPSERLPRTHLEAKAKVRKRGVEGWNPGPTLLWALVSLPRGTP